MAIVSFGRNPYRFQFKLCRVLSILWFETRNVFYLLFISKPELTEACPLLRSRERAQRPHGTLPHQHLIRAQTHKTAESKITKREKKVRKKFTQTDNQNKGPENWNFETTRSPWFQIAAERWKHRRLFYQGSPSGQLKIDAKWVTT